jgi:hypothetical protein
MPGLHSIGISWTIGLQIYDLMAEFGLTVTANKIVQVKKSE